MKQSVYIISGPAGVGKSATAQKLVHRLRRSSLISGDDISHIPVNGRGKPWLCQETNKLTWLNILSLTRNLLEFKYDVIIDYVAFPDKAAWLVQNLGDLDVEVFYIVLMVDEETIIMRDQSRDPKVQMGERSRILLREFSEALSDSQHVLCTQHYQVSEIGEVVDQIIFNRNYLIRKA